MPIHLPLLLLAPMTGKGPDSLTDKLPPAPEVNVRDVLCIDPFRYKYRTSLVTVSAATDRKVSIAFRKSPKIVFRHMKDWVGQFGFTVHEVRYGWMTDTLYGRFDGTRYWVHEGYLLEKLLPYAHEEFRRLTEGEAEC